jgi:hypothetical protein
MARRTLSKAAKLRLIEYGDVSRRGIEWLGRKGINPGNATVPLCSECNNLFSTVLEGPVSPIFRTLDNDQPISDFNAELLVRICQARGGLHNEILASGSSNEAAAVLLAATTALLSALTGLLLLTRLLIRLLILLPALLATALLLAALVLLRAAASRGSLDSVRGDPARRGVERGRRGAGGSTDQPHQHG